MYVAEDGKHMCIYVGPFSTQYVLQHRLQEQWASLESDKNRVSEFDLVYQCQHCAFSSGYLHNMKLHHLVSGYKQWYFANKFLFCLKV